MQPCPTALYCRATFPTYYPLLPTVTPPTPNLPPLLPFTRLPPTPTPTPLLPPPYTPCKRIPTKQGLRYRGHHHYGRGVFVCWVVVRVILKGVDCTNSVRVGAGVTLVFTAPGVVGLLPDQRIWVQLGWLSVGAARVL